MDTTLFFVGTVLLTAWICLNEAILPGIPGVG